MESNIDSAQKQHWNHKKHLIKDQRQNQVQIKYSKFSFIFQDLKTAYPNENMIQIFQTEFENGVSPKKHELMRYRILRYTIPS